MVIRNKGRVRNTQKTIVEGIKFDSMREANRYQELRLLEMGGYIRDLELQVPFDLQGKDGPILTPTGRQMRYRADFRYFDTRSGVWVIEDAKGHPTDVYVMKKAILKAMGVEIAEV